MTITAQCCCIVSVAGYDHGTTITLPRSMMMMMMMMRVDVEERTVRRLCSSKPLTLVVCVELRILLHVRAPRAVSNDDGPALLVFSSPPQHRRTVPPGHAGDDKRTGGRAVHSRQRFVTLIDVTSIIVSFALVWPFENGRREECCWRRRAGLHPSTSTSVRVPRKSSVFFFCLYTECDEHHQRARFKK